MNYLTISFTILQTRNMADTIEYLRTRVQMSSPKDTVLSLEDFNVNRARRGNTGVECGNV